MKISVGIDPGLRACGVGVVDVKRYELLRGWLVKNPDQNGDGAETIRAMVTEVVRQLGNFLASESIFTADLLVAEKMAIRFGPRGEVLTKQPSTIIRLAEISGGLVASLPARRVELAAPATWRGAVKRGTTADENDGTIWNQLQAFERERAPDAEKKSTGHNVVEAIGMAKWGARRFKLELL